MFNQLMRLEKWLETHIERLFGPRESVQPVEIARRMVRAMEDQRRISVNCVYVPNNFTVYVSEEDLHGLSSFASTLGQDLANNVRTTARRQSYAFTGPLNVTFLSHADLGRGEYRIEATFVEGEVEEEREETPAKQSGSETRLYRADESGRSLWQVTIATGVDMGATYTVRLPASIGRRSDCDIQLRDPKVSRVHARIEADKTGVALVDAESTNGTRVNGSLIRRVTIRPEDIVEIGTTQLSITPAGGE